MTQQAADVAERDAWLEALLLQDSEAVLVALGEDGVCRPMPAAPDLGTHRTVVLSPGRPTMGELVVPADRAIVTAVWERALTTGAEVGVVRTLSNPDRPSTLAIMDMRHRIGVRLGILTAIGGSLVVGTNRARAAPSAPPRRRREQLFSRLAESLSAGVLQVAQDRTIVYANAHLAVILGGRLASTFEEQFATAAPDDRHRLDAALELVLAQGVDQELEVRLLPPSSGEQRTCTVRLLALGDQFGKSGALLTVDDIDDPARMRELLRVTASLDPLTGCHSRVSVMNVLNESLAAGDGTAAIVIHLDRLKQINDEWGEAAGDELLTHVAHCVAAPLRGGDIVGRLGENVFLVVCRQVPEPGQGLAIAERIRQALHSVVHLSKATSEVPVEVEPRASIGVTIARPGASSDTVVAEADVAVRRSKRLGTGMPVLFQGELRSGPG